jgi:hypothetical protein
MLTPRQFTKIIHDIKRIGETLTLVTDEQDLSPKVKKMLKLLVDEIDCLHEDLIDVKGESSDETK